MQIRIASDCFLIFLYDHYSGSLFIQYFFQIFIECKEGIVTLFRPGTENAIHNIQILFRKKVQCREKLILVPVLNTFIVQQIN